MKICIISSAGGHLKEILQIRKVFERHEHFFVTFNREDAKAPLKNKRKYFVNDPKRNPFKMVLNLFQSVRIFLKEMPDLVISTGAGMAIPTCFISKIFGKKIIFIESMAAVYRPSFSGRMVYPISDLFIIQWRSLKKFYPKAVYGGILA